MEEIVNKFKMEFGVLENKFLIIQEKLGNLASSNKDCVYHPGVYIYHANNQVIKVGRHLTNSRKRALEHISFNTKNGKLKMNDLIHNPDCTVILINVKDPDDYHWVAAIEIYMERVLNPLIRSKRH